MRESHAALAEPCLPPRGEKGDKRLSKVEASGWLGHVALVLSGAAFAAHKLAVEVSEREGVGERREEICERREKICERREERERAGALITREPA